MLNMFVYCSRLLFLFRRSCMQEWIYALQFFPLAMIVQSVRNSSLKFLHLLEEFFDHTKKLFRFTCDKWLSCRWWKYLQCVCNSLFYDTIHVWWEEKSAENIEFHVVMMTFSFVAKHTASIDDCQFSYPLRKWEA